VGFEAVQLSIGGGAAQDLISEGVIQDAVLTSAEKTNSDTELHFYHILTRTEHSSTLQNIEITGKAIVSYTRRLHVLEEEGNVFSRQENNESTFEIK
jgi:hypothetical protein